LAFAAEPIGTVTYGAGDVEQTPDGLVVTNESVTVPMMGQPAAAAQKPAARQAAAAHHTAAPTHAQAKHTAAQTDAQATRAANRASLKKGEPKVKTSTTSTTTDVYDVSVKNKRGTTDYLVAQESVTNPQGKTKTQGVIYESYSPSKAARANERGMEVSLAGGMVMPFNKDSRNDRYGKNSLAGNINALKEFGPYFALGLDYMMLHPGSKTYGERHYHGQYAHNISVAGKLTTNPWNSVQVYLPMGVGMMNARMKTVVDGSDTGDNKWGASMYAGLGVQYDITAALFAGLEYRYVYGWISDKDLTPFHKDRNLQFHNVMLRMGMRF
jgi:opacity protein-like surface antigen